QLTSSQFIHDLQADAGGPDSDLSRRQRVAIPKGPDRALDGRTDYGLRKVIEPLHPEVSAGLVSSVQNTAARIGQCGTDAAGERNDVVVQRAIGAIRHDRDRRKDEKILGHRLTMPAANHGFTSAKVHLPRRFHFSPLSLPKT